MSTTTPYPACSGVHLTMYVGLFCCHLQLDGVSLHRRPTRRKTIRCDKPPPNKFPLYLSPPKKHYFYELSKEEKNSHLAGSHVATLAPFVINYLYQTLYINSSVHCFEYAFLVNQYPAKNKVQFKKMVLQAK